MSSVYSYQEYCQLIIQYLPTIQVLEVIGSFDRLATFACKEPINGTVFPSPNSRAPVLITHRIEGRPVSDRVARGDGHVRARVLEVSHNHPGIVTSCTPFPSGKRGLNVELTRYYEGGLTLYSYLQQQQHGGMSPTELMRLMGPAVSGLAFLHNYGLVHRDVKPSNIFVVDQDGGHTTAILGDLETADTFGVTDSIVRTQLYAPPEAFPPRGGRQPITPAGDVFCLGVTVAEMLVGCTESQNGLTIQVPTIQSGRGVYVSDGVLSDHMKEALGASHPRHAERLLNVLERAIAPNPSTRPSVLAFWRDLGRVFTSN